MVRVVKLARVANNGHGCKLCKSLNKKNVLLVSWSVMVFCSLAWSGLDRWLDGHGQHRC